MDLNNEHIEGLRDAFARGNLTLYLGAGVSVGNGLPTWSQLVLAMYFTAVEGDWKYRWRPYPNYLYAIAEWQLSKSHEPPEITAQKIRQFYRDPKEFLKDLWATLYAGFVQEGNAFWRDPSAADKLCEANRTLDSVAELCRRSQEQGAGVQAVVTYNYDNLLETATQRSNCQFLPVWKSSIPLSRHERPIFHVHGYLPAIGQGSEPDEIVFTEEQYHAAANDPYSWNNLCQIQCMSSSIGLMVGLSLTDPNMRRLLNALKATPLRKGNFALLKKPEWPEPGQSDLEEIHAKALSYLERFARSGVKPQSGRSDDMLQIFKAVNRNEQVVHLKVLDELGITPIWYDNHSEVPTMIKSIIHR